MGDVIRFPQERIDHYKTKSGGATILILPMVRIERLTTEDICRRAFDDMLDAFAGATTLFFP
jgi:hypothetical protein